MRTLAAMSKPTLLSHRLRVALLAALCGLAGCASVPPPAPAGAGTAFRTPEKQAAAPLMSKEDLALLEEAVDLLRAAARIELAGFLRLEAMILDARPQVEPVARVAVRRADLREREAPLASQGGAGSQYEQCKAGDGPRVGKAFHSTLRQDGAISVRA